MTNEMRDDAYRSGVEARLQGKEMDPNELPLTPGEREWIEGWMAGREIDKASDYQSAGEEV